MKKLFLVLVLVSLILMPFSVAEGSNNVTNETISNESNDNGSFGKVTTTLNPQMSALTVTGSGPEIEWNKTFGGSSEDYAFSVQQTSDDGYIAGGNTYSFGGPDAWLVKIDLNGGEEWNKTFGGSSDDWTRSVQQTNDGGYVAVGGTLSFGGYDIWLIKTDSNGTEEWNETYGGSGLSYAHSVQQTSDSGYIIAGVGGGNSLLIKTDSGGNKEWSKTYSSSSSAYSVQQTNDSGYIIAGGGGGSSFLIKTDSNGTEEWSKTYSSSSAYSVQQTNDSGYIMAGGIGENTSFLLIKTHANGTEEWRKTLGQGIAYSVQQTNDGGYIVAGYTGEVDINFLLIKTHANGTEEWNKTIGGLGGDYARSVRQTNDGGYIVAGYTDSFDVGNYDMWLIKLESEGCIDNDGDGFNRSQIGCGISDCDDTNPSIYPGASELCNGLDDDCDGSTTDDGEDEPWYNESTICGIGACGASGNLVCVNGSQEDTCTPGIPGTEICNNSLDDDCDELTDCDDSDCEVSCLITIVEDLKSQLASLKLWLFFSGYQNPGESICTAISDKCEELELPCSPPCEKNERCVNGECVKKGGKP